MNSLERSVQGRVTSVLRKNGVEPPAQGFALSVVRLMLVGLEAGIQVPEFPSDTSDVFAVGFIQWWQFVDQALSVHPTQAMVQHVKLSGIITDNCLCIPFLVGITA